MNTEYIKNWLKENLTPERYLHSISTASFAMELASMYQLDEKKVYLAGLLHDCAKCKTEKEMLKIMRDKIFDMDPLETGNKKVLHAPVSAYLARNGFGVKDADVLSAIRWHTIGKMDMNTFEMIIFLADKIEPTRKNKEFNKEVMQILEEDRSEVGLKRAVLMCYKQTIKSLVDRNLPILQITIDNYNELLKQT